VSKEFETQQRILSHQPLELLAAESHHIDRFEDHGRYRPPLVSQQAQLTDHRPPGKGPDDHVFPGKLGLFLDAYLARNYEGSVIVAVTFLPEGSRRHLPVLAKTEKYPQFCFREFVKKPEYVPHPAAQVFNFFGRYHEVIIGTQT